MLVKGGLHSTFALHVHVVHFLVNVLEWTLGGPMVTLAQTTLYLWYLCCLRFIVFECVLV
jgi:hypothetical protein